ncbi:MAG TPA: hypothetical protein DCO79_12255 [Spirochaeta sp.]|nr:hypothetical protein [Spirochaeta sp.]
MHQDEGHYAGKHQQDSEIDDGAAAAVKKRVRNEKISCRAAHDAALEADVSPAVIGKTLDLLEIRINGCQLGLFGHGGKDHGKVESALPQNHDVVRAAIKAAADDDGIGCLKLWQAAEASGCSKRQAASVCDEMDINIRDCQLGAF